MAFCNTQTSILRSTPHTFDVRKIFDIQICALYTVGYNTKKSDYNNQEFYFDIAWYLEEKKDKEKKYTAIIYEKL